MHTMKNTFDSTAPLKKRSDLHISRKVFHAAGIGFVIGIFYAISREQALIASAVACLLLIPIDWLRIRIPTMNAFILKYFGRFMRSNEKYSLTGGSYFLMGLLMNVAFFPKSVAILALAMLAIGDPIASIIGVLYGKDKLVGNKSLQGCIAAFAACSILSFCYFFYMNLMTERLLLVSLLAGFIGATSELIPIGKIDDNLSFPVLASCMLYVLFLIFGGFL